jgi:hypothetical protein
MSFRKVARERTVESRFGPGGLIAFAGINQHDIAVLFHLEVLQNALYTFLFLPRKKDNYLDRFLCVAGFLVDLGLLLKVSPQMCILGQF